MAAQPSPDPSSPAKVPAHAWTWLQRSRSVLAEIGGQLYGSTSDQAVLDRLKQDHAEDEFVQDLVARVVCDVAFNGRVPDRRPAGARWDRGLTWWAAHLAGVSPQEFEARSSGVATPQPVLFGPPPEPTHAALPEPGVDLPPGTTTRRRPLVSVERRAIVRALRDVLAAGDGETVPAAAVRALLAELEGDDPRQG